MSWRNNFEDSGKTEFSIENNFLGKIDSSKLFVNDLSKILLGIKLQFLQTMWANHR